MKTTTPNPTHNHPKGQTMKTLLAPATISIAALPAVGADLDGGTFAGLTTRKDGTHCAVVLLPQYAEDLTWEAAKAWATEQGGELPNRPVAALLFANVQDQLKPEWHWTSDKYNASYAWLCYFGNGGQYNDRKSSEGSVVAVRLIPLTA